MCGLHESGEIDCWLGTNDGKGNVPPGTYVALSAGSEHACAVRTYG